MERARRLIRLRDGRIVSDERQTNPALRVMTARLCFSLLVGVLIHLSFSSRRPRRVG